ncbi:MAG: 3-dehydroquinate synthase [Planctomycetota bacterium]|jgi:3-dehydroquinate synthase
MPEITINTSSGGSYGVRVASGILDTVGEAVRGVLPGAERALVVSDTNVWPLYGARVLESLRAAGTDAAEAVFPSGEASKRLATVEELCDAALTAELDRASAVIALGGGVVGDIAGLVAALYMRGIAHVQLPTSLLAMVDSSVGGKTAADLSGGKNLVGAFHQPSLVLADPETLVTLPERELAAGAAEIVKAGLLGDAALFELVEAHPEEILARHGRHLPEAISRSVELKRQVVEEDEREAGRRALLNLGHTFGHALETYREYEGILHGEAIAVGMAVAARLAVQLGRFGEDDAARVRRLLGALGLSTELGDADRGRLLELMHRDKKTRGGALRLVLPVAVGRAEIFEDVPEGEVRRCLEESA